ncbi:MAG TPA: patatin-like phospholipase family protein [Gemmata sp.]|jgi:predicted patatin/cPLA2 family phospholipase|nr:patatin-like phospholipase family protein [Gemmata sp.]
MSSNHGQIIANRLLKPDAAKRSAAASFILAALCISLVGCTSRSRYCPPSELSRPSGLVQLSPSDELQPSEIDLIRSATSKYQSFDDPSATPCKKKNVLVLSGGGMYGAYSVGVLSGWTTIGTRPEFDVVTGISTGALIANYAFLGTNYDREMVDAYTTVTNRNVYRKRWAPAALITDAAASSEPLKKMIENQVDDTVLAAVAQAHLAGRRLYVGTTNIDTRRLVIWDMGAIATSGRPDAKELYRKVLLASASPPGFLPPVQIPVEVNGRRFTELHVDGGATTGVFLQTSMLNLDRETLKAGRQPLTGSDAYVIVAGKLYADPACTDRRAVKIGESALRSLLYSQTRSELSRINTICQLSGMNFHLTSIPEDMQVSSDILSFDKDELKRLYDAGYTASTGGRAWRDTPPGGEPYEQNQPRTGNQFLAPGAGNPGG